ncbi:MAG: hypothetical protein WDO16_19920 [Bacteroidota bacterium]
MLDLQVAQKMFKKKGEIRLTVSDILNQTRNFYMNSTGKSSFQKDSDPGRFGRIFGTTFSVTFNYSIFINSNL